MQLTKALYDEIAPGEIFWIVTTKYQRLRNPIGMAFIFVCAKGKKVPDWAMYSARAGSNPEDVARYGDMIDSLEDIGSICPCDDEVLQLYRK